MSTGKVGSKIEEIVEFEDDTSEKELEQHLSAWLWEHSDANFYILEDGEK